MTSVEPKPQDPLWLERFHAGERAVLEGCYRAHFTTVMMATGAILSGADQENVVHDVFVQLLANPTSRASFHGGSLSAWLRTIGRNRAIDYRRRHQRETRVEPNTAADLSDRMASEVPQHHIQVDAQRLLARFGKDGVPQKWSGVFKLRFISGLSQREAAKQLGISRTTLAYREARLRHRLKAFADHVLGENYR